jgi:flagellar biosynthesis/type III secretory pathway protein FliH
MSYAAKLEAIYAKMERRVFEKGVEEGLEQGIEKGIDKGLAEGIEKGAQKGSRDALMDLYQARFGTMPEALRERIEATTDVPTLRRWVTLFGTATADEIAAVLLEPRSATSAG